MEWIKCSDRMPEENQHVWVYGKQLKDRRAGLSNDWPLEVLDCDYRPKENIYFSDNYICRSVWSIDQSCCRDEYAEEVTHWMPYPEIKEPNPPKE